MARPVVVVTLYYPVGNTLVLADGDVGYLTQECGEITDAMETLDGSNAFVTSEVQLQGRDGFTTPGPVSTVLAAIPPDSTDYRIKIVKDGEQVFSGFISPETVQLDPRRRTFAFGCVGLGGLLARTDASTIERRTATPYTGLVLSTAVGTLFPELTVCLGSSVTPIPASSIVIDAGDVISLTTAERRNDYTVKYVIPNGTAPPYNTFTVGIDPLTTDAYTADTAIELLTNGTRNRKISDLVDNLFDSAGLNKPHDAGGTYAVNLLAGASAPFASPVSLTGLSGHVLGICGSQDTSIVGPGKELWCSTSDGTYRLSSPPGGSWVKVRDFAGEVRDWEPAGSGYFVVYGRRRIDSPRPAVGNTQPDATRYSYFAYDLVNLNGSPLTARRWELRFEFWGSAPNFAFTVGLYEQTSTDAVTWSAGTLKWDGGQSTLSEDPIPYIKARCFGVDYLPIGDVVYMTHCGNTIDAMTFTFAAYDVTYDAYFEVESNRRGIVTAGPNPVQVNVWTLDSLQNNTDVGVHVYSVYRAGPSNAIFTNVEAFRPMPSDIEPDSIRRNKTQYFGLTCSTANGVWLLTFLDTTFNTNAAYPPVQLALQGDTSLENTWGANRVTLTVVYDVTTPAAKNFPMYALWGTSLHYINTDYSGVVPYVDYEAMTCADALAHLSLLVNGLFTYDAQENAVFRSRDALSGKTIAQPFGSAVLDDTLCTDVQQQPIWYKTCLYIRIENSKDPTIFGEAGDLGRRDSPFAVVMQNPFITSISHAAALAKQVFDYMGSGAGGAGTARPFQDVTHFEDGRDYRNGNTYECVGPDGSTRWNFQLVQITRPIHGTQIKVSGVGVAEV